MNDILQALIYLHYQKPIILHRDIKPERNWVHNSKYKIADFGWSNNKNDFRNTYCGTPDYWTPEMINGTGSNEKLDILTLEILMFELLHRNLSFWSQRWDDGYSNETKTRWKITLSLELWNSVLQFHPKPDKQLQLWVVRKIKIDWMRKLYRNWKFLKNISEPTTDGIIKVKVLENYHFVKNS